MSFTELIDVAPRLDPTMASDQSEMPFEIRAGAFVAGELRVQRFEGHEAFSEAFRFDIEVSTGLDPLTFEQGVLGRSATFVMRAAKGTPRAVRGVVASIRQRRPLSNGARCYRLRLVPTLWLLRRKRNTRIFQDLTVVEIISALLDSAGIAYRFAIERTYPKRAYVVQYRESDFAFVQRLSREAGLFYFFEWQGGISILAALAGNSRELLVFGDGARAYPPIDSGSFAAGVVAAAASELGLGGVVPCPTLAYRPAPGLDSGDDGFVTALELERTLRTKQVSVHDYDFVHPLLDLTASVEAKAAGEDGTEQALGVAFDPTALEAYDEHYDEHELPEIQARSAQTLLDGYRARAFRAEGDSAALRLAPGHRFAIDEHPDSTFNRELVVAAVRHRGYVPQHVDGAPDLAGRPIYENHFEALASTVPARPKPQRRRIQQVVEIATVVGPEKEEIHTDQYGRIKVQFPWDRDGKRNERSSCWLRVGQQWAGSGWGAQFIPRVGMEVLVTFLGGDTDRPLVTGCLYNATHPPPFDLPEDKTRSGWRTQSSPGGGGYNELSFEDEHEKEQIRVHAQRDLDEEVNRNHTLRIGNDEVITVARNRTDTVIGNRDRITQGKESTRIALDQAVHIVGNRSETIEGAVDLRVTKDLAEIIGGSERRETAGSSDVLFRDDRLERVQGSLTTLVGRSESKRAYALHVEGVAQVTGTTEVEISSDKSIVLRCGKSTIRLTPEGIELSGPAVNVAGKDSSVSAGEKLVLKTKGSATISAEKMLLKSKESTIALAKEVKIDGSKILLNSPSESSDDPPPKETPPTSIELVGDKGKPLPGQRFVATYDDGTVLSGFTDKDGKAVLPVDGAGTIVFPDVSKAKKL